MCKEMNKYDLEPIFDLFSFEYHIKDLYDIGGSVFL